jgi:hypothetical protein
MGAESDDRLGEATGARQRDGSQPMISMPTRYWSGLLTTLRSEGDVWIPLSCRSAYGKLASYFSGFRPVPSEGRRYLPNVPLSLTAGAENNDTLELNADLDISGVVFDRG